MEKTLTSSLVETQLPDFVRSDYPIFVTFLKKYYEWLETIGNVHYEIESLKDSIDTDTSSAFYLEKLKNDLGPLFPQNIVGDKKLFLKLVTQFYKSNGTPESVKFLFRILFNENIDIYFPKDDILIASDGKWVLPLALRVSTTDPNIFNIEKCLLTGRTSKATAIVEKVTESVDRQLGVSYIELYISNIKRLFTTGETVTATYNNGITNVTVSAKLIGALSEIKIDPNNRGLFYNGFDTTTGYPGDPVVILGGLNPLSTNPIGASANVGDTTKGSITDIIVSDGGFGFRKQSDYPNSIIFDFKGGFENAPFGTEAAAELSLVDEDTVREINVSNMSVSTLHGLKPNIAVMENTAISNITSYQSFNVYPMAFVTIVGSGGGYRTKPQLETYSLYNESFDDSLIIPTVALVRGTNIISDTTQDLTASLEKGDYVRLFKRNPNFEEIYILSDVTQNTLTFPVTFQNDITGVSVYKLNRNVLYDLGSIGRINVVEGGENYALNDIIVFSGGSGYGANAYVSELFPGNNGIKTVTVNNHSSNAYVIGGEGYRSDSLPTLSVQSANGSNSILYVSEVTGDGEKLDLTTSRIGAISSIRITSYGFDYVSAPKLSLRVIDLKVTDATVGQLFVPNTVVYQGTSNSINTFKATVDRYDVTDGFLRVFDYSGVIQNNILIKADSDITTNAVWATVVSHTIYGDGRAKATAKFENGLIRYPGLYLDTDGQPSADKKLQDGEKYHNFSYVINTRNDYAKFKTTFGNLSHPIGTKTFVTRLDDNTEIVQTSNAQNIITLVDYIDTFNISNGSNSIISTNSTASLSSTINVGDTIVLKNVSRRLMNASTDYSVNVVTGSNVVFGGANLNFINDLQDGDTIFLSTGNTVTVKSVTNSRHLIVSTTLGVTSTTAKINLVYDEVTTVKSVNNTTIIANTKMRGTDTFVPAIIQKNR